MNIIGLKTLLFTLLVPGTVTVLVPALLLSPSASSLPYVNQWQMLGFLPLMCGLCIYFWCAWDFTTIGRGTPSPTHAPHELVIQGLYRYCRNPMYLGIILILAGETVLFASLRLLIYTVLLTIGFHLRVIYGEEPVLSQQFSAAYLRYCSAVGRWWPRRLPPKHALKRLTLFVLFLLVFTLAGSWLWGVNRNWNFVSAAQTGNIGTVRQYLDAGLDPDVVSQIGGITALHMAIFGGKRDVVKLLLARGANPTNGLWKALGPGRTDIVKLLIEKGADVNVKTDDGISPLPYAKERGNRNIVNLLKAAGAKD